MKTIAAKYVAPLVLAAAGAGGFAGFELSEAFSSDQTIERASHNRTNILGHSLGKGRDTPKDDSTKRPLPGLPKPIIF